MSLGSHGRREPVPSSDVDSGMAWRDAPEHDTLPEARRHLRLRPGPASTCGAIAASVADCVRVIGWRLDPHGVTASGAFSASSIEDWRRAIERWLAHPSDNRVLIATSDPARRPRRLWPAARPRRQAAALRDRVDGRSWSAGCCGWPWPRSPRRASCTTSSSRAPASGRGRSTSSTAGCSRSSTWRATRRCGRMSASPPPSSGSGGRGRRGNPPGATEARILEEAYELFSALRLEHQVGQLEQGQRAGRPDRPEAARPAHPAIPARRLPGGRGGAALHDRPALTALAVGEPSSAAARAYRETPMPGREHALARGELHRGRLRDDRPRSRRRRDRLLRHRDGERREGSASRMPATSWCGRAGCRTPRRSASTACARRIWRRPPPSRAPRRPARGAHRGGRSSPTSRAVERGFLGAALAEHGLELLNPLVDTAALDRELRRLRRHAAGRSATRSALGDGPRARAARPPPAPRRRRRAHHRPGLHRAGHPPRGVRAADRRARSCASRAPERDRPSLSGLLGRLGLGRRSA